MEGGGSDDVERVCFGVEHGKAVVVFGGDDDIFLASGFGEGDDVVRIEAGGVEFGCESFIVGYRDRSAVHDPLAYSGNLLAVPGSGGDRVEAPVDEHAEAGCTPPCHASIAFSRSFGILNGLDGMIVGGGDTVALSLGECCGSE